MHKENGVGRGYNCGIRIALQLYFLGSGDYWLPLKIFDIFVPFLDKKKMDGNNLEPFISISQFDSVQNNEQSATLLMVRPYSKIQMTKS